MAVALLPALRWHCSQHYGGGGIAPSITVAVAAQQSERQAVSQQSEQEARIGGSIGVSQQSEQEARIGGSLGVSQQSEHQEARTISTTRCSHQYNTTLSRLLAQQQHSLLKQFYQSFMISFYQSFRTVSYLSEFHDQLLSELAPYGRVSISSEPLLVQRGVRLGPLESREGFVYQSFMISHHPFPGAEKRYLRFQN